MAGGNEHACLESQPPGLRDPVCVQREVASLLFLWVEEDPGWGGA